uniref:Adult-specific cuticular protein ACP-20-like n=1 Tax=Diabrotica virgifera virgifera TaxID=50390 RepID=A0A6P7GR72_DIAVI
MIAKVVLVCAFVAVAHGVAISVLDGGLGLGLGGHGLLGSGALVTGHSVAVAQPSVDLHAPANYQFKYGVQDAHTGDNKQQSEVRVGDTVRGEYSLAEPDGTIRVVKYTADPHNGFNAVVSRVGHAAHPQVVQRTVVAAPIISHAPVIAHAPVLGHGIGLDLGLGLH